MSARLCGLLVQEGGGALAAVHAVEVGGHEGAWAAAGALLAETLDLSVVVHLENRHQGKARLGQSVCVCVRVVLGSGTRLGMPARHGPKGDMDTVRALNLTVPS